MEWGSLLQDMLLSKQVVDGLAVFTPKGEVVYTHGVLDLELCNQHHNDHDRAIDQFLGHFHGLCSSQAEQECLIHQQQMGGKKTHQVDGSERYSQQRDAFQGVYSRRFHLLGLRFSPWKVSAQAIYAVSPNKERGMLLHNLPHCLLLTVYKKPLFAQQVIPVVESFCDVLRGAGRGDESDF
ncbi:hypothetical protein QOT17_001973 [Balamuthia mandrillaris]